ncbi:putative UDP-sugar transporter protein SLC35A4 [Taenia solium]|eukprot:TsM_000964300 transcript=TsM_000964300 gene=TsM_000964300
MEAKKTANGGMLAPSSNTSNHLAQPKLPVPRFVFRVLLYSSYTILVHLCENDGRVPFNNAAAVLVIEVLKFFLSVGMFLMEVRREQRRSLTSVTHYLPFLRSRLRKEFSAEDDVNANISVRVKSHLWIAAPFAVPAILYAVTNNIAFFIQMEMDPATYQTDISPTVVFVVSSARGGHRQWVRDRLTRELCRKGVVIVTLASPVCAPLFDPPTIHRCHLGTRCDMANYDVSTTNSSSVLHITFKGIIMISIYCTVSGFASVYTEYVLKKRVRMSLNVQNATLYVFGIITNGLLYVFQEAIVTGSFDMFQGFSIYTWILVVTQAISGIFIGFVMKYASSILRLFIISSAMIVTTVLSVLIFGLVLKTSFLFSAGLVVCALILYHY